MQSDEKHKTASIFEETQNTLPKESFLMLLFILVATDLFILVSSFVDSMGTPLWMFFASTAIFTSVILFFVFVKLKIRVENGHIHIRYIKKYDIPFEEIIDYKTGDVDIIRNYSGWGIKKVTFKNFISNGYDLGVSLKLTGHRVFTFSLSDPEEFVALLPKQDN